MTNRGKIVLTGAAGLLGQNLIQLFEERGLREIVAIDKNEKNADILERFHPSVRMIRQDLATDNEWQEQLADCSGLVIGHAQIGGISEDEFVRNNIHATKRLLEAAINYRVPYIVHISSSVVNSKAVDYYTETKKTQEQLVVASGIKHIILRPTLMFGWFDRKHLGWLARFMERSPVFPIPGSGRYLRQPLYVGDFASIISASIEKEETGVYNITGQERIHYIDLMRNIKEAIGSNARILRIPYVFFWMLLKAYESVDKNPPFTTKQLKALATPDIFEVIDWPSIFGVDATPLKQALAKTFRHPVYSKVVLEF
jgi:nucleoside-diphosphate-sugar epimerase